MQYKTSDYRMRLGKALHLSEKKLGEMKFSVVNGELRKKKIREELLKVDIACKDRRAAALLFEQQQRKAVRVIKGLLDESDDNAKSVNLTAAEKKFLMSKYFGELQNFVELRQNVRILLTNVYTALRLRIKEGSFFKWKTGRFKHLEGSSTPRSTGGGVRKPSVKRKSRHGPADAVGVGDVLLAQCEEKRVELQAQLRDTLCTTATVKQKLHLASMASATRQRLIRSTNFRDMPEGIDMQKLVEDSNMRFLLEGDGYAKESKFELAKQMYDAQVIAIRARTQAGISKGRRPALVSRNPQLTGKEIKLLGLCHGRLGKMFLSLSKASRAIVEFDRQLSLGLEIDDPAEIAEGF